jgi:hypothetical protein
MHQNSPNVTSFVSFGTPLGSVKLYRVVGKGKDRRYVPIEKGGSYKLPLPGTDFQMLGQVRLRSPQ